MSQYSLNRRQFLQGAAATATGILASGQQVASAQVPGLIKIDEPFHGAVLSHRVGEAVDGGLKIEVKGN